MWPYLTPTAQIRKGDPVTWILGWIAQPSQWTTLTSGPTCYTHIVSGFNDSFEHTDIFSKQLLSCCRVLY